MKHILEKSNVRHRDSQPRGVKLAPSHLNPIRTLTGGKNELPVRVKFQLASSPENMLRSLTDRRAKTHPGVNSVKGRLPRLGKKERVYLRLCVKNYD